MTKQLVACETVENALGHLIWFSVGEMELTREKIEDLAHNANLPERFLPPPIRPVDAFRRATSEVSGHVTGESETTVESILVREVCSDKEGVTRHLVKETADKKNKFLRYEHLGTFNYDRERETMNGSAYSEEVVAAVEKARALYARYKCYYTAEHIRRMVKTVLSECQSIPLRPAGTVYFVPRQHEAKMRSLKEVFKHLPGDNTEIHLMPLVDMDEQRQMLEQKLQSHVTQEIARVGIALGGNPEILNVKLGLRKLVGGLAETLKNSPAVSKAVAGKAVEQLQSLKAQVREYEVLLETNMSEVGTTLDVLRSQVRILLDRVELEAELAVPA